MQGDYIFWRDLLDTFQSLPPWLQLACLLILAALAIATGRGMCRLLLQILTRPKNASPPSPPAAMPSPLPEGTYWMVVDAQGHMQMQPMDDVRQLTAEADPQRLDHLP